MRRFYEGDHNMRVGIIGGVERTQARYEEVANAVQQAVLAAKAEASAARSGEARPSHPRASTTARAAQFSA